MGLYKTHSVPFTPDELIAKLNDWQLGGFSPLTNFEHELERMSDVDVQVFMERTSADPVLSKKVEAAFERTNTYGRVAGNAGGAVDRFEEFKARWDQMVRAQMALQNSSISACSPEKWTRELLGDECSCIDSKNSIDIKNSGICSDSVEIYEMYQDNIKEVIGSVLDSLPSDIKEKYRLDSKTFPVVDSLGHAVAIDNWNSSYIEQINYSEDDKGLHISLIFNDGNTEAILNFPIKTN